MVIIVWEQLPSLQGLELEVFPVGHFGAPWQPFWILQVFYASHRRSAQIKQLI